MNTFELSRNWFNFCFENPEKISPNHTAIYFFAIEHCNRLGGKEKFGFPSQMTCDAIGIKKTSTYIKYFNDIVDWGFFKLIERSSNQYSSNIISLIYANTKNGKALDKAFIKHGEKQTESIGKSNSPIIKQETINNKKEIVLSDVALYFFENGYTEYAAKKFFDYYSISNWKDSKGKKVLNWKQKAQAVWFKDENKIIVKTQEIKKVLR